MKLLKCYLLLTFLFVFQTVLGDSIRIIGILPDLMFILAVCVALREKRPASLVFALVCGLLKDFSLMQTFGLNAFITLYIIFLISVISEKYFYPTIFTNAIFTFSGSFLWQICYFFLRFTMWGEKRFFQPLLTVILPESIYDTLLSFGMYVICAAIYKEKIFSPKMFRRGIK